MPPAASSLGIMTMKARGPTDRMVCTRAGSSRFLAPARGSASDFIRQNESLEHFVGKHPPARRQADEVFSLFHQPALDKLGSRGESVLDRVLTKFRGQLPEADTTVQPQPKEETFLQRCPARNRGPSQSCPAHVLFQRIRGRKSHRVDVWSSRSQHRVRVYTKTEIRLPGPIL